MVLDFFIVSRRPERLPKAIQAQDLQCVNKWKNLAWYRSERRALLGLEQSSPTEPSNARRSVCAANDATPKILTVVQFEMTEREPSRFAAGGDREVWKIRQLLLLSNALRTETVRAPAKRTHCQIPSSIREVWRQF
jgi:hypothetical protein